MIYLGSRVSNLSVLYHPTTWDELQREHLAKEVFGD